VFFAPNLLGEVDNYIPANSLVTPTHIVPEWYFLPFYAILRAVPDKLLGVVAMFASLLILFVLPWLDTSKVRSATFRPIYKGLFWLFLLDCLFLGWIGANPAEGNFILMGRLATAWYFAHLLIFMPLVGKLERTRPVPESIGTPVLKGGGTMPGGATAAKMEKS
jgi:ubiquinol-cytochrome c reductase cytochrome b subunit